ncbi:MAG TPA: Ig-like domain-containing protein, partial [Candidatus Limnocylindrales bacterium]
DWNAASLDQQSFPIGKGDQAVTFTSIDPTPVDIGDTYTPTATSGSGLTVSFSIAPASGTICSIGTANLVTFHAVGDCVINGDQGGDADWNPAATKAFQIGVGDRKPVCAPATPVAVTMNLAATGPSNCSDPDLQPLTYSIGTDGTKGHATINAAGTWTYTPNAKQTGSDSFTVVANDSIIDSDAATVSVTITNHFDPRNDGVTLVATVTTQVDVLANDSGGSGQPLTIKAVGQGTLGTVTTDGHVVTYHPNGCAVGTDVFTYTVSDGLTTSVPKSVFVTIARPGTSDGLGGTLPLAPVTDTPGIGFITGSTIGSTTPMRLGWCSVVAPTTSFWYYRVVQSTNGGVTWPALATMTAATSMTLNLGGYRYVWGVRAVDRVGRSSSYATSVSARVFRVQDTGTTAIAYRGSWGTVKSTAYSGGTERWATSVAATATYRTTTAARAFAIVASKASNRGSFRVYVDGILVATVSERTSTALYRNVVYARLLSPGVVHTIIIKPAGTGRIDIDAILTLG